MMDRPQRSECTDERAKELFERAYSVVDKEPEAAVSLLREAAGMGCTASMVLLGDILIDGSDDERKEALELFEKAHKAGDNMGSRNLGYCYAIGLGVDADKSKAAEWYRISGDASAIKLP